MSVNNPRVQLTLPDGVQIDVTDMVVTIEGGYQPMKVSDMVWYCLEGKRTVEASIPDRELEDFGNGEKWNGWGDPPGTH